MIKIAVDAMGGDFAPKEMVEGAMLAIARHKDIEILLFGKEEEINKYLTKKERITVIDCREVIPMDCHEPMEAIRGMKDASMVKAMRAVATGDAQGCVSSGPTQALVVGAHLIIKRIPGFKRPALCPLIPTINGGTTVVLDMGANLEVRPEHLLQQAQYGLIYAKEILGKENPSVGLMNIGTEEGKGRQFENDCYKLLSESGLNFVGNVETKDLLDPPCDVLISDGFTTNMVVKGMEGTLKGLSKLLKKTLTKGILGKIGALFELKNLKCFKKTLSPEENANAQIIGIKAPVVKPHGNSKAYQFSFGITHVRKIVMNNVIEKVEEQLIKEQILSDEN